MWLECENSASEYDELTFCQLKLTNTQINSKWYNPVLNFGCWKEPPLRNHSNESLQ